MCPLLGDDRDHIVKHSDEVSLPMADGLARAYPESKALGALIDMKIIAKRT